MRKEHRKKDPSSEIKEQFWRLGMDLVSIVVIGMVGGFWVDRFFSVRPWGMIGGFFFGCLAAGIHVYRLLRRFF